MLPERSHCRPHTRKRPPSQTIRAPVVAVRWVTQAITARATSSGSTTRLSGVTAAIFSSAVRSRPATKSVATALGPHQVFVLRPYSRDLNPIEQVFPKLKRLLQKANGSAQPPTLRPVFIAGVASVSFLWASVSEHGSWWRCFRSLPGRVFWTRSSVQSC